jgi:HTH-type transcriptional regulator/antitoxin HipB
METVARTPLQFGNEIRENRRRLGMTQEQLAARAGVRQRTVSDIESAGKARLDTVMRILAVLSLELVVRVRTKGSAKDIEDIF